MSTSIGSVECSFATEASKAEVGNYEFSPAEESDLVVYHQLVREAYDPLGFLNDHAADFMPRAGTRCFVLSYQGDVIGSCALTAVPEGSVFHELLPAEITEMRPSMTELNNIILRPELRGGIGLALLLYHAAEAAIGNGSDLVVGITRYQTLRHFVEAGAIPVLHEPLHLLGREDLHDFAIYYDMRSQDARTYLRERARRLFGQAAVLSRIRDRVGGRSAVATRAAPRAVPAHAA